eukprot:TRINITY_DN4842_c0_g1_i4.p1 TRINITY_DN4842_c0_g1~~TRINITY_DN4842_c0_g1_i4.p1  ORF type:complete len:831 (+),score=176.94 TRINITY_DN4842_c0_g1_i4:88-2580(+)
MACEEQQEQVHEQEVVVADEVAVAVAEEAPKEEVLKEQAAEDVKSADEVAANAATPAEEDAPEKDFAYVLQAASLHEIDRPDTFVRGCLCPGHVDEGGSALADCDGRHGRCEDADESSSAGASLFSTLRQCCSCGALACPACLGPDGGRCKVCCERPDFHNAGQVEEYRNLTLTELQVCADSGDKVARRIHEERQLLSRALRLWTREECSVTWSCRHVLLAEDPSWLAPLMKNLMAPEGLMDHLLTTSDNRQAAAMSLFDAVQVHVSGEACSNLCRAAFVVVKLLFRCIPEDRLPEIGLVELMERAIDLLRPMPVAEFGHLVDQLVDMALGHCDGDEVEMQALSSQVRLLLFEKANSDVFFASRLLLSFRAHGLNYRHERDLMSALESESDECRLARLGSHADRLMMGDAKNCTSSEVCKPFPLPTHAGRFTRGTVTSERRSAGGATGAQVLRYHLVEPSRERTADVLLKQERDPTGSVVWECSAGNFLALMDKLVMESKEMQDLLEELGFKEEEVRVTYHVLPIAPGAALVEMVPDAEPLERARTRPRGLREPGGLRTLHEYLRDVNAAAGSEALERALKVLAFTSAKSTVLSFVPHLGDRHGGNVLLTHRGVYLQIDYGYVLGYEPLTQKGYELLRSSPPVRLDYQEIFAAVGKQTMDTVFWKVTEYSFKALRSHSHLLQEGIVDIVKRIRRHKEISCGIADKVLSPLFSMDIDASSVACEHLAQRLMPGLTEEQAKRFIEHVLLHYKDDAIIQVQDHLRRTRDSLSASTMKMTHELLQRAQEKWKMCCARCPRSELLGFEVLECPVCKKRLCPKHFGPHSCRVSSLI